MKFDNIIRAGDEAKSEIFEDLVTINEEIETRKRKRIKIAAHLCRCGCLPGQTGSIPRRQSISLEVTLVANSWMRVPDERWIALEVVKDGFDASR